MRRELNCVVLRLCSCVVRVSLAPHSNTQVGCIYSTASSKALRPNEIQWMTCADSAARSGSGVPPVQFFGGCGFLAMRVFSAQCTDACSCTGVLKSSLCSSSVHSGRGRVCVGVSYSRLYLDTCSGYMLFVQRACFHALSEGPSAGGAVWLVGVTAVVWMFECHFEPTWMDAAVNLLY